MDYLSLPSIQVPSTDPSILAKVHSVLRPECSMGWAANELVLYLCDAVHYSSIPHLKIEVKHMNYKIYHVNHFSVHLSVIWDSHVVIYAILATTK